MNNQYYKPGYDYENDPDGCEAGIPGCLLGSNLVKAYYYDKRVPTPSNPSDTASKDHNDSDDYEEGILPCGGSWASRNKD